MMIGHKRSLILGSRESMALPISAFSPIRFHSRPPFSFVFAFRSNRFVGPHRVLGQLLFSSGPFISQTGWKAKGTGNTGAIRPLFRSAFRSRCSDSALIFRNFLLQLQFRGNVCVEKLEKLICAINVFIITGNVNKGEV